MTGLIHDSHATLSELLLDGVVSKLAVTKNSVQTPPFQADHHEVPQPLGEIPCNSRR